MDAEKYLTRFTPEELLEAAINFYGQSDSRAEPFLRMGFEIAGPNGWKHIAPAWISLPNPKD